MKMKSPDLSCEHAVGIPEKMEPRCIFMKTVVLAAD
jgi:hypothetical protein